MIKQNLRKTLTTLGDRMKSCNKDEIFGIINCLGKPYIKDFIMNMSDDIKLSVLPKFGMFDEEYIIDVINSMQSDEKKLQALSLQKYDVLNIYVAETIHNDEDKLKLIDLTDSNDAKVKIASLIQSNELKLKALEKIIPKIRKALEFVTDQAKAQIIMKMPIDELKLKLLDTVEDDFYKENIIRTIDDDKKLELMTFINDPLISTKIRSTMPIEIISQNLELILQCEGITEGIEKKANLLKQMQERNDSLYKTIDFRILDEEILASFSQQQLEQIVCYTNIEKQIIALKNNSTSCNLFSEMLATISQDSQSWDVKTNRVLKQLNSNTYQELINNINQEDIDINNLVKIMQMPNYFNIQTQEDLEKFFYIKRNVCDRIINGEFNSKESNEFELISEMNEIDQIKFAVLQKLYGLDLEIAKTIIEKYGNDIESLDPNSDEVVFVEALQEIIQTDNIELLKRYYSVERGIEEELIDSVTIENQLKHDYGKMFNNGLLQPENLEEGDMKGTLKAGTDFRLIITSVAPYIMNTPENFEQDWNRKAITSRGFCCSY